MSFAPLTAGSHVGLFMLTSCVSLYQGILLLCCPLLWWVLMLLCRVFEKIRLLVGSWTTFSHSSVPSCCHCWMGSVSSSTSVQARQQWWNTVLNWFPMPSQLNKLRTVFILTNYRLLTYKLLLFFPKPDGTGRLCVDFRWLNAVTVTDPYPMPHIDALLYRLGGAVFMTKLDMTKAYFQVPVAPEHV